MNSRIVLGVLLTGCLLITGCVRANLYELPPPPPESERRSVSLIPGEDERRSEKEFQEARASLIRLKSLLDSKRFDEALDMMSQETVSMLEFASPDKKSSAPATAVLTLGQVDINGKLTKIDPVDLLLAADMSNIKDSVEGETEQESARRKELFAVPTSEGEPRKIVMIKEGGTWLLHRPKIQL